MADEQWRGTPMQQYRRGWVVGHRGRSTSGLEAADRKEQPIFFIRTDPTGGEGKSKTIPVCTKIPSLKINGSKYLGVEELLVPLKRRNKPL